MRSLRLTLGLVGALALLGCGPRTPDEFDDAVKVCDTFKRTGMITECSLSTPRLIDVRMNTTPGEAQNICVKTVEAISQHTQKLAPKWQLRIFSPYSGDHPIAVCPFK
jgi:hypothetical protein